MNFDAFQVSPHQDWMAHHFFGKSKGFPFSYVEVSLDRRLSTATLQSALNLAREKCEILRTQLEVLEGTTQLVQCVAPTADKIIPVTCGLRLSLDDLTVRLSENPLGIHSIDGHDGEQILQIIASGFLLDIEATELLLSLILRISEVLSWADKPSVDSELTKIFDDILQFPDASQWIIELGQNPEQEAGRKMWIQCMKNSATLAHLLCQEQQNERSPSSEAHTSIHKPPKVTTRIWQGKENIAIGSPSDVSSEAFFLSCFCAFLWLRQRTQEFVVMRTVKGRAEEELKSVMGPLFFDGRIVQTLNDESLFSNIFSKMSSEINDQKSRFLSIPSVIETSPVSQVGIEDGVCFEWVSQPDLDLAPELERAQFLKRFSWTSPSVLKLVVEQTKDGYRIHFLWDDKKLSDESISELADGFMKLCEQARKDRSVQIGRLAFMSDSEIKRILQFEQGNKLIECEEHSVLERLFKKGKAWLERTCTVDVQGTFTYGQIIGASENLALNLKALGLQRGEAVSFISERAATSVVSILGIQRAGGCYVAVDPSYPLDRQKDAILQSGSRFLLHTSGSKDLPLVMNFEGVKFQVSVSSEFLPRKPSDLNWPQASDPAYIIFTSGSSGKPKGVVVNHGNLLVSSLSREAFYGTEHLCTLLVPSFAFDSSVAALFGTLVVGGKLVLATSDELRDMSALELKIEQNKVESILLVPSLYRLMLSSLSDDALKTFKRIIVAGEECNRSLIDLHFSKVPKATLHNEYGPTEGTVWCTGEECSKHETHSTIGRVIPGYRVLILNALGERVPQGASGEIVISGGGIVNGYLGDQELTQSKFRFRRDSILEIPSTQYFTGDLGCQLPDGRFRFLGRIDSQVKIRGFRLELGEIDSALERHPLIQEACVSALDHETGEKTLAAFVAVQKNVRLDPLELRSFLEALLPAQSIPSSFLFLEQLPRTPSGKIDRKALSLLKHPIPEDNVEFDWMGDLRLQEFARVWEECLKCSFSVGPDAHFFMLGGDSIRAVRLRALARSRGFFFTVKELYDTPVLVKLWSQISNRSKDDTNLAFKSKANFGIANSKNELANHSSTARFADAEDVYPATRLQSGMLFHSHDESGGLAYHDIVVLNIRARYLESAILKTLELLFKRHEILRAHFDMTSTHEVLLVINRKISPEVLFIDARGQHSEDSPNKQTERWIENEKKIGFDSQKAPLIRFAFVRISDEVFQFCYSVHHAILDGWSSNVLLNELFIIYLDFLDEKIPIIQELPVRFKDYSLLEKDASADPQIRNAWQDILREFSPTLIPSWAQISKNIPQKGLIFNHSQIEIPALYCSQLRKIEATSNVTMKTIFLTLHLSMLSNFIRDLNVVTGVVTHGRPEELGSELMIGLFLNTLPFAFRIREENWTERFQRVFELEKKILPIRWLPLGEVLALTGERKMFESIFNFVHFDTFEKNGEDNFKVENGKFFGHTNFPMVFTVQTDPDAGTYRLNLTTQEHMISKKNHDILLDSYFRTALQIAENGSIKAQTAPAVRPSQIDAPTLSNKLVEMFWEHDSNKTLTEITDQFFLNHGQNVALKGSFGEVRYGELGESVNRLALKLLDLGIKQGDNVALILPKSPMYAVSALAILKVGAVFCPFDITHPWEGTQKKLNQLDVSLIICLLGAVPKECQSSHRIFTVEPDIRQVFNREAHTAVQKTLPTISTSHGAYIIFTSGTTGTPKAVVVSHRSIVQRIQWGAIRYGMTSSDITIFLSSPSFDFGIWEIFGPLCTGGTVLIPRDGSDAYLDLAKVVRQEHVTLLHFVPSIARTLFAEEENWGTSLRIVFFGGEPLTWDLVSKVARQTQAEIWNQYGPTEAAVDVTWMRLSHLSENEPVPIGIPSDGTTLHVLDRDLRWVEKGFVGRLYVEGTQLAMGYLNSSGATAQSFIPCPWLSGERLYDTGDLAFVSECGQIHLMGRADSQVKINGIRIELEEIESIARRHALVADSVATTRNDGNGIAKILCYLVIERNQATDSSNVSEAIIINEVRALFRSCVPQACVPFSITVIEAIPRLGSGKIDRSVLPEASFKDADERSPIISTQTLNPLLTLIWKEVLGVENPHPQDDFFDVGGDSMKALVLVSKIRQKGIDLTIGDLLLSPTLLELDLLVTSKGKKND